MKRYYITGQIAGLDLDHARGLFAEAADKLRSYYLEPVTPFDLVPTDPALTWEDYLKGDIKGMLDCDGVYVLRNWKVSRGATIEVQLALRLGMDVIFEYDDQGRGPS